jgi:hypothetical protein
MALSPAHKIYAAWGAEKDQKNRADTNSSNQLATPTGINPNLAAWFWVFGIYSLFLSEQGSSFLCVPAYQRKIGLIRTLDKAH